MDQLHCVEICAGAGGQSLGLEGAGFVPEALIEVDKPCCDTLRYNRPQWSVVQADVRAFNAGRYRNIDLFAGGVPCPPFSKAGKQLGEADERDLFPETLRLIAECRPRAVMLENVRGLLDAVFADYRHRFRQQLEKMGYIVDWRLLNASDFGVSQLRPRVVIVALQKDIAAHFAWPDAHTDEPPSVGNLLFRQMSAKGWKQAECWTAQAGTIAPTIVGGSKKHGGPDLGPTRAKRAWAALGVDGMGIADAAPERDFVGRPRLTVAMVAKIQGFPDDWQFVGKKTPAYRQVGNAFPPPVAQAVATRIARCLLHRKTA